VSLIEWRDEQRGADQMGDCSTKQEKNDRKFQFVIFKTPGERRVTKVIREEDRVQEYDTKEESRGKTFDQFWEIYIVWERTLNLILSFILNQWRYSRIGET